MVKFTIPGSLPASWEDFFGSDGTRVTIHGGAYNERVEIENDGWIDVFIKDKIINSERAKSILSTLTAKVNEYIVISALNKIQSIQFA